MRYIKSGIFFIDVISTVPAMITLEKNNAMSFFKFLRLVRYKNMFNPFRKLLNFLMPGRSTFQRDDFFDLIVILFTVLMIAHMSACTWIFLGHIEDHLPENERHTWRFNSGFGSDF